MRQFAPVLFLVFTAAACGAGLSVEEAVAAALKSHPDAHSAVLRHESAKADQSAAEAALSPRIDLNGDYFPTKTLVIPANGVFSTRQSDALHADITGSYPLWDFGRNQNAYRASSYKTEEAGEEKRQIHALLIEQVWVRYYTAAYLKRVIESSEQSARFYEALYTQAVRMRESGLKTRADESRFKASWMEAAEHLGAARGEYDKALQGLGLLVGTGEIPSIEGDDFDRRSEALTPPPENLREELSMHNPQLRALRSAIEHARALSEGAEKEGYGSVTLVGSYGTDSSLSSYESALIGVRGTIPLYDGGKNAALAQKSRIALSLAQKEYERSERGLWQELYAARSDFNRSDETIEAKIGVIDATQKALTLMEGRYAQGLSTHVDVLEAHSALENARIALFEAKFRKLRAWAQIQRLLNRGCDNDVCKY